MEIENWTELFQYVNIFEDTSTISKHANNKTTLDLTLVNQVDIANWHGFAYGYKVVELIPKFTLSLAGNQPYACYSLLF